MHSILSPSLGQEVLSENLLNGQWMSMTRVAIYSSYLKIFSLPQKATGDHLGKVS